MVGSSWSDGVASAGVPRWILSPLPLLEVVIGALTAVRFWVPVIPLVLTGLLLAFTTWIVVAIRSDDVPTCACFGSASKKPIGWRHVVRNSALIALAVSACMSHVITVTVSRRNVRVRARLPRLRSDRSVRHGLHPSRS